MRVGQVEHGAVAELDGADVERVALAVLRQLGAGDAVAAAALVGIEVGDGSKRRAELGGGGADVVAHPLRHRLGHAAAQHRPAG